MSSLNGKRMLLAAMAVFGLAATAVCAAMLAMGVVDPTRERIFLVGSILIVSTVCLILSARFKADAIAFEEQMRDADRARREKEPADPDDVPLPQNEPHVGGGAE